MFGLVARASGSIAPLASVATSPVVASSMRPVIPIVVEKAQQIIVAAQPVKRTDTALYRSLSKSLNLALGATSVVSHTAVRFAHTDVRFPNMDEYRHTAHKNSAVRTSDETLNKHKVFSYLVLASGCIPATYAAKAAVTEFVMCMSASADVLALAKIEVNLAEIPEGKNITVKWRNKPLFIRHRPAEEIAREQAVSLSDLRDKETDSDRVQKPEWLIVLGICTHLGCVPIANAGEYGGYYCPCHGSHYDTSGRIRKGPAPTNLEVPPYEFTDDSTIVVG